MDEGAVAAMAGQDVKARRREKNQGPEGVEYAPRSPTVTEKREREVEGERGWREKAVWQEWRGVCTSKPALLAMALTGARHARSMISTPIFWSMFSHCFFTSSNWNQNQCVVVACCGALVWCVLSAGDGGGEGEV